ncbi:MAG: nuclear transport factor 2 family protein [Pseudonocardiaceae bacterium]
MLDEAQRKAAVTDYFAAINEGEPAAIVAKFADDAVIEDPVGGTVRVGRDAVEEFAALVVASEMKISVGTLVAAQDGTRAAVALSATFRDTLDADRRQVSVNAVDVIEFDADARIRRLQAFWGISDLSL